MAEFTLLKVQLDDASLTANAPFSNESEVEVEEGDAGSEGVDGDEESTSILPFFVGLLFLLVLGVAAKKLIGGSSEPPEPPESHDD